jgi:hypothetical protein
MHSLHSVPTVQIHRIFKATLFSARSRANGLRLLKYILAVARLLLELVSRQFEDSGWPVGDPIFGSGLAPPYCAAKQAIIRNPAAWSIAIDASPTAENSSAPGWF